eukprot:m.49277 g.49277  ORF g.49277 m.49277 type:complete len:427 (-) comp15027_c0_seq2:25-1305(-)
MGDDDTPRRRRPEAPATNPAGGGEAATAENVYATFILSENLLDKLKLLDYDTAFCAAKGFRPIHRHYFAIPDNPSDQLYYFANLFSWLLGLTAQTFPAPQQYDDPHTTTTNIMLELRKQGFPTDFSQSKLKQGYGDEVCQILNNAAQNALKARRWKWESPQHADEGEEQDVHEDHPAEVTADTAAVDDKDDEVEEDFFEEDDAFTGTATLAAQESSPGKQAHIEDALQAAPDQAAWKLEVERVLPLLKVHLKSDERDWRSHIEDLKQHEQSVKTGFAQSKPQLDKLHADVTRALEKINNREKFINSQLEHIVEEYRTQQDSLAGHRERYKNASKSVNELSKELATLSEELETVKAKMDERGNTMTDSSPVVRIKQALTKLKAEISQMDLQIGVVTHTLLAASVSSKDSMVKDMHADVPRNSVGDTW